MGGVADGNIQTMIVDLERFPALIHNDVPTAAAGSPGTIRTGPPSQLAHPAEVARTISQSLV
ncbi:hypothetical protein Vqi01_39410 [Micromonospora qiuiae]|uniref:Uncharacterized protein n=2 Tax=Micromonospora qiuiae TaxID=502268 RepID=A0ABQ4JH23_9ACTN|nr:hypothetical protein Vqi01_39410 [Micromonospora qiuiae]